MKPKAEAKRGGSPGRASRSPRVPFSAAQIGVLEGSYRQTRYLSSGQVGELAAVLGLSETQRMQRLKEKESKGSHVAAKHFYCPEKADTIRFDFFLLEDFVAMDAVLQNVWISMKLRFFDSKRF
ncbi:hypothetical protein KIL84_002171 [Mauremys mutica]|uniref:Homeobox domain-containing protein n=1 Tax=Mauremys mutica TaxID=74926 RepID=A0A9D3XJR7_9SAUR|nr:hypothetical protein KIL84_002171 [Mauremys mutica]